MNEHRNDPVDRVAVEMAQLQSEIAKLREAGNALLAITVECFYWKRDCSIEDPVNKENWCARCRVYFDARAALRGDHE